MYSITGEYYMLRSSLEKVLAQLPSHLFVQIHRSFAVGTLWIPAIGKDFVTLVPHPHKEIPFSKKYSQELMATVKVVE